MLLVAHDLKLFDLLAARHKTLQEICRALQTAVRPAEALVAVCASLGYLDRRDGRYSLTALAEDYLLETGPAYYGGYLDMVISAHAMYSFESVKRAVLTDSPQAYGGDDVFESHEERADRARAFTRAMHSADLASVCTVADEVAAQYGLQGRVRTHAADMRQDPFSLAEVQFYSQIFHDWPAERCRFLTRKSFESLAPAGRIILHEIIYNDEKTQPIAATAMSVQMLLFYTEGRQYSGRELTAMLAGSGFVEIEVKPTFGCVVIGRKP